jgi:hypothetical protein
MTPKKDRQRDSLDREVDRIQAGRVGDEDLFPRSPLEDEPVDGEDPRDEPGDDLRSIIESDCGDK